MQSNRIRLVGVLSILLCVSAFGAGEYERTGWVARIGPGFHEVMGTVTIVDERTLDVEHFTYDGAAPLVYMKLGAIDTYQAFFDGLEVPPELDRRYDDECFTLTLPGEETLDGYRAISVWCAEFDANFGSAMFTCPPDFNASFFVDADDLIRLLSQWGPCEACPEDLDDSGVVDFGDLVLLLTAWGICGTF